MGLASAARSVLRLILIFIVLPLAVVFALANREAVTITAWPLPYEATMPLFLVLITTLVLGILIGAGIVWLRAQAVRAAASEARRTVQRRDRELAALRQRRPEEVGGALPAPGSGRL